MQRIPNRLRSPYTFFFHCDYLTFAQASPREYTLHLRPNDAGEACSCEPDLKVVRDLRLRCGGFGFGGFRDDAELLHKAQSVPVDPAFCHLAASDAGDAYPGDGELLPRLSIFAKSALMGSQT